MRHLIILVLAVLVSHTEAQEKKSSPQFAKKLVCETSGGVFTRFSGELPRTKTTAERQSFSFSEMSPRKGTARLSGAVKSGMVKMEIIEGGIIFFEQTPLGLIITTVFAGESLDSHRYPLVDSRHNSFAGSPMLSQRFGWCLGEF